MSKMQDWVNERNNWLVGIGEGSGLEPLIEADDNDIYHAVFTMAYPEGELTINGTMEGIESYLHKHSFDRKSFSGIKITKRTETVDAIQNTNF